MDLIPRSNNFFLDDVFGDFFKDSNKPSLKCDIYEKDDKYYIEMDTPGYTKDDVIVDYSNGYLAIGVSKSEETNDDSRNYIRRERKQCNFSRSFYIGDVDGESIKASFKNGSLVISIPKEEKIDSKKTILIEED